MRKKKFCNRCGVAFYPQDKKQTRCRVCINNTGDHKIAEYVK